MTASPAATLDRQPTVCVRVQCCESGWWDRDDRLQDALTAMSIPLVWQNGSCVRLPVDRVDELRRLLGEDAEWLRVSRPRKG